MAVTLASTGYVGLRTEGSFGSGGTVDTFQPIISESLIHQKDYFYPQVIQNSRQQQGGRLMRELVTGGISFYVTPNNTEKWWQAALGNASSPYSAKGQATIGSVVVHVDRGVGDLYTSGDKISSMDFSSNSSEGLVCNVAIEGKGGNDASIGAPTFNSGDDPYMHSEATFEIGGAQDDEITAFTLSLNNNLITDLWTGASLTRREIPATSLLVTGTFTRLFTDTTARALFLANTQTSFKVTFARNSNTFILECAKINMEQNDAPLSGFSAIVNETIPFTAQVDDSASDDAIKITVT